MESSGSSTDSNARLKGAGFLLVGAVLQVVVCVAALDSFLLKRAMSPENETYRAMAAAFERHDMETHHKLKDDILNWVGIQATIAGVLLAIVSLFAGRWVAKRFKEPPFLYYALTGVLPGFPIFWGWQSLLGRVPDKLETDSQSIRRPEKLENRAAIGGHDIGFNGRHWICVRCSEPRPKPTAYTTFRCSGPQQDIEPKPSLE